LKHAFAFVVCLLWVRPACAAVDDYLGKNIAEVHLRASDVELRDAALVEVVETKVDTPLTMAAVRETIAHLFGLGRYQDVQVDAALNGGGVVLTYRLVPRQLVRRIAFEGPLVLADSELRRAVVDRYGPSPSVSRAAQVVSTLETLYRDHGYPRAQIAARSEVARDGTTATLVFAIQPGLQARVGSVDVQGAPPGSVPALLKAIDLKTGDPYDGLGLDARLANYAGELRAQGYYEARMSQSPRYVDEDRRVDLVLNVDAGPHVEIVFQGDPLTSRERDDLVPIAREHSVNEDILEDSKFAIEGNLRARGYCNPRADYQRNAASGVLRIVFTVARGPLCTLERADVAGNAALSAEELNPLIQSQPGQPFIEDTLGADVSRIEGLYRRRGFAGVKVATGIDRGEERSGVVPVRARLVITEGIRSVIQSVVFDGNVALDADALRQAVTSLPGQAYFEPQIAADSDSLALLYLNRGYQEVAVQPDPRFNSTRDNIELHFLIREGPQVIVDHVLIAGNVRTKTETIAVEVQLKSGQPLSQQAEDDTRTRLTALGIFRRVEISYLQLPGNQTHRDVVITVEEAPLTTISYGVGIEGGKRAVLPREGGAAVESFQVAPRGSFVIGRRNLFGKDRSLNLSTRVSFTPGGTSFAANSNQLVQNGGYGFNEYLVRLAYGERRVFGLPADGTFAGGFEQTRRTSFYFSRRSANAALTRRVKRNLALSARYSIDTTKVFNISIAPLDRPLIDRLFPQVRLSTVSGSAIRDTRDDPLDPGSGGLIGLDGELAARRIGSEVGFFKTFLQGFAYRRLGSSRTIAAFGARVGLATGFARTIPTVDANGQPVWASVPTNGTGVVLRGTQVVDDLPPSERFFAGGDTTVRGFTLDRLGRPNTIDVTTGLPLGGLGLIVLNAELRTPLRGNLAGAAFLDVGNVFAHVNDINLGQLRAAVGFGFRYKSPIGPIRVDLGFKLAPQLLANGDRERPTALHISLGQAF
jgi:outer membrane protein insertion porin family